MGKTERTLVAEPIVARLDAIARRLPAACQEDAWTGQRWRVRGQTFAHVLVLEAGRPRPYVEALGRDEPVTVLIFRMDPAELDACLASDPAYFRARWGSNVAGLVLDDDTDWDEVEEVVIDSYCLRAPRKLVALVDRPP